MAEPRFTRGTKPAKPAPVVQLVPKPPPPKDDLAEAIAELNDNYAVVLAGNKAVVLREFEEEVIDPNTGETMIRPSWILMKADDFHLWLANKKIVLDNKIVALSKLWIGSEQRRQYEGLELAPQRDTPGKYNLWRGFAVEPEEGDCTLFLDHVRDNVCQGSVAVYNWVVGWMAQIVHHPEHKVGTSLVLIGDEGVGKTIVGKVFGSLFPEHYVKVNRAEHITGRFNAHLARCLLLHADESFWAGDKNAEGTLKDLVTGDFYLIELKGIDAIKVRNSIWLLITTNHEWAVPVSLKGRRFCVLQVGEKHIEDKPYFKAILDQMEQGGRAALLHHLLNYDLSQVDLRTVPKTEALLDQKKFSWSPEDDWWFEILQEGRVPARRAIGDDHEDGDGDAAEKGIRVYSKDDLYDNYINHANKVGVRRRAGKTSLGMYLHRKVPGLGTKEHVRFRDREDRKKAWQGNGYIFPTLRTCRKAFAKALEQELTWEDGNENAYWR